VVDPEFAHLSEEVENLPLSEDQWEIFLRTIKLLYQLQKLNLGYLWLRFNLDDKILDRIVTSLLRLQWASFSKPHGLKRGHLTLSDKGKKQLDLIKQLFEDEDEGNTDLD
jgi:hypothetical protein